jgi:hypothetical protein
MLGKDENTVLASICTLKRMSNQDGILIRKISTVGKRKVGLLSDSKHCLAKIISKIFFLQPYENVNQKQDT